ncbi:hypothetical protein PLEOSDRAFT_170944 [Pleurotus ostreatus PC15]|uniref:Uncharacterized protein n=1 Tax=Pleurotus ostreatus (strain PC15) TaxID=1137138 RepID=A0A067NAA9_PLEO1|nr:hypothetical protein PLEOSDRAFT_170944 [Pleurotus ostreatus PC15]
MKWRVNAQELCWRLGEVRAKSNEVGKEGRGSLDEPQSVYTSLSESEMWEDSGVTGRDSDAKGVDRKEVERKGSKRERKGTKGIQYLVSITHTINCGLTHVLMVMVMWRCMHNTVGHLEIASTDSDM